MLASFFKAAMLAPGRQLTFRRTVGIHVLLLAALSWGVSQAREAIQLEAAGYVTLILGIVEGASLIGWRLTQMPKSQALEFLLVSPIQPRRLFLAEALVGTLRFALICFAGLPVLIFMAAEGTIEPSDLWVLAFMPFV